MKPGTRVVTIWSTYGDYHVARLNGLSERGFDVVPFAHCDYDRAYPFFKAKPESLVVINAGAADEINPLLSLWRTWRLLRVHRPDIVLTTGYERTESMAAWLYARTSRVKSGGHPTAVLMLNSRADDHQRRRLVELVKSVYLRVFDGFLASGSDTQDYLGHLGVPESRIELGYNCVDAAKIATLVAGYRATSDGAGLKGGYFLCVARLIAKKNIPGVLRAYHSYLRDLPDALNPAPLRICGDGPERGAIEDLIQELGLANKVSMLGELDGEAVAQQLAGCKALVLASTHDETWGLVVNEAMAAGCPVLVSRQCGCARDLVEQGVNGFAFDGHDSNELARHMLWLHTNGDSLQSMGSKSHEIAGRFTPARFADSAAKLAARARPTRTTTTTPNGTESMPAPSGTTGKSRGTRVVTIWSTYGDYHVARVNGLRDHGFDVVPFAHCEYDRTYPFFQAKPDAMVVINPGGADGVNPLLSLLRTWRLLRIHRPDIVLTIGYERTESMAAWLYARTSRVRSGRFPIAVLMLENRADDHPRSPFVERVKSVYLKVFDGFLASGSDTRDYLRRLGVPASRIELGYSCVDTEKITTLVAGYRPISADATLRAGYFLCVARLVAKKNVPGVLRAYRSYRRAVADSTQPAALVICGDGPERSAIEGLIQHLGLGDTVSLLGEVDGVEAVAQQLAGCKALVLASTNDEQWGLVVNEAMAAGCPVLVSRQCGCARDLVQQGVNGFIFDGEDSEELARYMVWLHTHGDLLAELGRRSKEVVGGFTTARFAESASRLAAARVR